MKYLPSIILLFFVFSCSNATESETKAVLNEPETTAPPTGIVDVNPLNDPTPLPEMINFFGLGPGARLVSPYTLKGRAIGSWYFEGDFPVTLVGEDGNLIASTPAKAMGDWTKPGWVPYQAKLSWLAAPNTKAKLVLTLDNPAGEGEGRRRAVEIPVLLK
jgi:hypothetical protein